MCFDICTMNIRVSISGSSHDNLLGNLRLPSTTLYYKACTKDFPVLLCTVYHKACTNHFPVLLCTTKLAQSISQYHFVLQSLHKTTSQHYFVVQSLHKVDENSRDSTQQNERCFAASPIDTATPEEKQRLRFRSFPHRHGDVGAAKRARFCSFPHRHGDVGATKQTSFCSFPHRHGDARGKAETRDETRFCSFPHRHGDARGKPETRDETRGRTKTSFVRDILQF